ncbi:MAG TPA: polysaccharide deacetylase family protein [Fimbriimonadaceae bacterium]
MKRLLLTALFLPAVVSCSNVTVVGSRPAPAPKVVKRAPVLTQHYAVPVLMYHRIDNLTPQESRNELLRDLTVSPQDFEQQVSYLAANGFTFLTVDQVQNALLSGSPLPEKAVAISMDDGYKDNFEKAFPILKKYNACATIFLVTSTIGTPKHLTWPDIDTMHTQSVGYGSHTVSHLDLTTLPRPRLDYELCESKRIVESHFNQQIGSIAYPSGEWNDLVVERTRSAGYLSGWKKGGGPVEPGNDPLLLPRVRVRGVSTMEDFQRMVWSGVYTIALREKHHRSAYIS